MYHQVQLNGYFNIQIKGDWFCIYYPGFQSYFCLTQENILNNIFSKIWQSKKYNKTKNVTSALLGFCMWFWNRLQFFFAEM